MKIKIDYINVIIETIMYVLIVFLIYNLFPNFTSWAGVGGENSLTINGIIFYIIVAFITTLLYNFLKEVNKKHKILK